jgi:hypothetical protein
VTETYTTKDFVQATRGAEFISHAPGAQCTRTYASAPERSEEFDRFEDLASRLIAVPKTEIGEGQEV